MTIRYFLAILFCIALEADANGAIEGVAGPPSGTAAEPPVATPRATTDSGWRYEREAEAFDTASVGKPGDRSAASGTKALVQFGCRAEPPGAPQAGDVPCSPQAGDVQYGKLEVPETEHLWISLRYSKNGEPSASIQIYLDDEKGARTELTPEDQGSWNDFAWSDPMDLGAVGAGTHRLRFSTAGQLNGVADLDKFVLSLMPVVDPMHFLRLSDDEFLERISLAAFQFFREQADPETGVVKDRAGNVAQDSLYGRQHRGHGLRTRRPVYRSEARLGERTGSQPACARYLALFPRPPREPPRLFLPFSRSPQRRAIVGLGGVLHRYRAVRGRGHHGRPLFRGHRSRTACEYAIRARGLGLDADGWRCRSAIAHDVDGLDAGARVSSTTAGTSTAS